MTGGAMVETYSSERLEMRGAFVSIRLAGFCRILK